MRGRPHQLKPMPTKNLERNVVDELRPEYDLASVKGGVRGKYYARATAGTTMVLLEPDVAEAFPDGASVNQALRSFFSQLAGQASAAADESRDAPTKSEARKTGSRPSAKA